MNNTDFQNPMVQQDELATCYHCGEACKDEQIEHDDHLFCCDGCQLVYDVLKENDLCQYYSFEEGKGNSPEKNHYKEKFDYLNLPELQSKLLEFTDGRQSRVNWLIPKMHCSSCIWLLEQLHRLNGAVSSSVVNFPEKKVRITYDSNRIKLSELASLLAKIGYEPYISLNDLEGDEKKRWNRTRLYKIGIAGFTFGNIMMLSLPEYFDLGQTSDDQQLRFLFGGLNVVLSLPVFFYSASDFFTSAWKALRGRYLNIDAPIALALLCVFLTSLYQVFSGTGPGYFDSLAGAVFFMLLGRYFQDKTYASISFERDYRSYFPVAASIIGKDGEETSTPVTDLAPGDRIVIRNRELIPVDSVLESPKASIDYSFVSGEAAPVERRKGDTIYSGGRQEGGAIVLEVLRKVSHSYLTQLWNNEAFSKQKEDPDQALPARINRYFSVVVLLIAAVTFTIWALSGKMEVAFNAFTTVLLVACPCALLLSATFTNGNLLSLFGKYSFYLKNAFTIERLAGIDTVIFDKTGTITLTKEAEVTFVGAPLTADELVIIKTLASQSSHPLSRLIVSDLKGVSSSKRVLSNFTEREGQGIKAMWGKQEVRLGSAVWLGVEVVNHKDAKTSSLVHVSFDGTPRGFFEIRSKYRPELEATVTKLKNSGYQLYLLSGDKPTDIPFLSSLFGAENLHFNQTPEQKLKFVEGLQQRDGRRVLMVGDGLNDAGALRQSTVGLAVSDDVSNFSPACDVLTKGPCLANLPNYIGLAKTGQLVVKITFALSLVYNLVGLSFAITGDLSPVVAAVLMPFSSITIVLFTTLMTNLAARKWMIKRVGTVN
jgi:Cu+-exporting ATPase